MHGTVEIEAPASPAADPFWSRTRLLARLDHPYVARVADVFCLGEACYLVTNLVEGPGLSTLLEEAGGRPFTEPEVLGWLEPVLDALAYRHRQGVVHGDLKPANLLLAQGAVWLLGSALGAADPRPSPCRAPELYEASAEASPASDIYALGATMYVLLAGVEPPAASERARGAALRSLRASPRVEAAVTRALALAPEERYQAVGELRAALAATGEEEAGPSWRELDALQAALEGSHWPIILYGDSRWNEAGWDTGTSDDDLSSGSQEVGGGRYRWAAMARDSFTWWSCPNARPLADCYLTVEVRQQYGPGDAGHGLIFRAVDDDHYAFYIHTDGQFTAYLDFRGEVRELLPWARSAAIRRDEANRLSVVAEGSHFTLLVNDQYVGEFDDETLPEGKAGLLMSLEHEGDEAGFDFSRFELRAP